MSLSSLKFNPSVSRLPKQESSFSPVGGGLQKASLAPGQVGEKGLGTPRGLRALQQDSFEMGSGRGSQLQKLLQGAEVLLETVKALGQLMELSQSLGTPSAGGAGGAGGLGAAGGAEGLGGAGGAGGVEGAGGAAGGASPSPFENSSFSPDSSGGAPVELNPAGGSTDSSVSASGDAKLGPGMPPALAQYKGAIESAASKAGVPAAMLAGQIWQESRGNLQATTINGGNGLTDTGLMQVNPNTFGELQAKHPELQGKNLSDPATNILAGAFYMKDMKQQFGSWDLALRAYNSGPNGVDKSNPNAIPAGTGDATYVQKVKQFWDTISTGKGSLPA